jgi:hypothetical protein
MTSNLFDVMAAHKTRIGHPISLPRAAMRNNQLVTQHGFEIPARCFLARIRHAAGSSRTERPYRRMSMFGSILRYRRLSRR